MHQRLRLQRRSAWRGGQNGHSENDAELRVVAPVARHDRDTDHRDGIARHGRCDSVASDSAWAGNA